MTLESPHDLPRPDPPSTPAIEAFCQYLRLLELEQEVEWSEYRDERPELAVELERLLSEYERVTAILDSLAPAASFSARLRAHYGDSVDPGISLSGDLRPADDLAPSDRSASSGSAGSSGVLKRLGAQSPDSKRYEARREIARGGMGAILEVWDAELRRTLAMKVVLTGNEEKEADDSEGRAERRLSRFLEEAQITGQLDHPGIVPVHDIGIDERGRVFFTMQLVDGLDLRKVFELSRMDREGWTENRVIGVLVRVCEAMAYAHSKGVVHRDLKPANIMVGRFGEAFVMDWGLAKVVGTEAEPVAEQEGEERERKRRSEGVKTDRSDSDTATDSALKTLDGDVVGTPAYMSPEQARGRLESISPRSDVYSIGAMLYHLLSGHMPYEPLGEKVAAHTILEAVRKGPPWPLQQLNPEVNGELAAICAKAMERDPDERYDEVMALGEDLRAWIEGRGVQAYTSGLLYETRKWMERNKATTAALLAMVGLALVSLLLFIWQQQVNVTKLKKEREDTALAVQDATLAKDALQDKIQELRVNEGKLVREAGKSQRATEDALKEAENAKRATDRANDSAERARKSAELERSSAYRSHINAAAYSLRLNAIDEARLQLEECDPALRGWEWYHLRLATDASIGAPIVHELGVTELSVSADGDRLLSYGFGLPARVWDPDTGRQLTELQAVSSITPFNVQLRRSDIGGALHPSGEMVVLSNPSTPYAQLFNVSTQSAMLSYKPKEQSNQVITGVAVSADGEFVVTISRDGIGRVHGLLGGDEVLSFSYELRGTRAGTGALGELTCLALSHDGELVVAGARDGNTLVWSLSTGEELQRLAGRNPQRINDVDVSADGSRILTASEDGSVAVWDARNGAQLAMMHGHVGPAQAAVFSEDGFSVVSGGEDMTIRSWDAASGRQLRVFHGHDNAVEALVPLHDGRHVASASLDNTVRVWDLGWEPAVTRVESLGMVTACSFSPGGRTAYVSMVNGPFRRIDLDAGRDLRSFVDSDMALDPELNHFAVEVSPNGELLAIGYGNRDFEIRDANTGELLRSVEGLSWAARFLSFSADSRFLALAGRGKQAMVLDLTGGLEDVEVGSTARRSQSRRALRGMDLSPDGSILATIDVDGNLRTWNARSGDLLSSRRGAHDSGATGARFSPDGRLLATFARDKSVKLWEVEDLTLGHSLVGHGGSVQCLDFSPDGTRIVSGDTGGEVRLWSTETGDAMVELVGAEGAILDVRFSPDGASLAASSTAGIRIWESASSEERYASRERELQLDAEASVLVSGLFRDYGSPALVEIALRGDADVVGEIRERTLKKLSELRANLGFCDRIVAPLLLSGEGSAYQYGQISQWLDEFHDGGHLEPLLLALRGATELRLDHASEALQRYAELRELVTVGPREALFECLASQQQGEHEAARARLTEAHAKLLYASSREREALAGLLEQAQAAVSSSEGQ